MYKYRIIKTQKGYFIEMKSKGIFSKWKPESHIGNLDPVLRPYRGTYVKPYRSLEYAKKRLKELRERQNQILSDSRILKVYK